jgi:membrane-associated phospholipid phosphatase
MEVTSSAARSSDPVAAGPPRAWIRRWLFWSVALGMFSVELAFALCALGVPLSLPVAASMPFLLAPLAAAVAVRLERGREAAREPAQWLRWTLTSALMYAVWAIVYFVVGRQINPGRVHLLDGALEARIPLVPSFSLLYVLLYPIFVLPYLVVRDRPVMRRLVAADLAMVVVCTAAFALLPVGIQRPAAVPVTDLGTYLLSLVWGNDLPWNCMPSEHCMAAMIASLAIWESRRKVGVFAFATTLLIGLSTLFTKQHYLVDVLAGYVIAIVIYAALRRAEGFVPSALVRASQGVLDRDRQREGRPG